MLDWAQFGLDTMVTFGAGMLSLLLVFGAIGVALWRMPKFFAAWREMVNSSNIEREHQLKALGDMSSKNTELTTLVSEVVRSNTAAFHDSGQANQNMAKALELLTSVIERLEVNEKSHDERIARLMNDHDIRGQAMNLVIAQISERTSACHTRRGDPR